MEENPYGAMFVPVVILTITIIGVIDYYHAAEHLSNLAEALFGKKSEEAKQWYAKWASKLKAKNGCGNLVSF